MLSKRFFLFVAGACLLALTLAFISPGCSGSGTPIAPDIDEITIFSPVSGSTWGSPEGVWEIAFSSPAIGVDINYNITIDNTPVILNSFQDLEDGEGILSHVVVPTLLVGNHQLVVEAKLFGQLIAKGDTTFVIKPPDRELNITITVPNSDTNWDIGDTNTISWEVIGDKANNFEVSYSEDAGTTWRPIGTTFSTSLEWEIPVVNNPAGEDFLIQVIADDGIAADQSSAFRIDFGPVASFIVDADDQTTMGSGFNMNVAAKDQYGNIIANYSPSMIYISWEEIEPPVGIWTITAGAMPVAPMPQWVNGVADFSGYFAYDTVPPPVTFFIVVTNAMFGVATMVYGYDSITVVY